MSHALIVVDTGHYERTENIKEASETAGRSGKLPLSWFIEAEQALAT